MIYYFSGTGNTRWAARQLAEATNDKLVSMSDVGLPKPYTLNADERLGFCFPVHGWMPPRIVRDFIAKLDITNSPNHYCYALCTCGDNIGMTMEILQKALNAKAIKVESVFSLTMPETYVALPFMYTDPPAREHSKLDTAKLRIKEIIKAVADRECGITDTVKGPMPWVLTHVIGAFFNKYMITDRPFNVDPNRCVGCGKCAEVCPVGDIDGARGHEPQWNHDGSCTSCLSCYHHCPHHAIEYGPLTTHRGQYYFGIRNDNK